MNYTPTNPTFNEHLQAKSKPAPGSKAASLVERPIKAIKKSAAGIKKTGFALAKSAETPAEAYRKLEIHKKSSNVDGSIRLAPTHEFAFPPPITRAGQKNVQGGNISVHTEGVESASTFDSADFATQPSGDARSQLNKNHGCVVIGSKSTQKKSSEKMGAKPAANGLRINVLPPASRIEVEQKDDLIMLDEDSEQFPPGAKTSSNNALSNSTKHSVLSPGIPDIMDEDLDVGVFQSSLTPRSAVAPRCVTYRGARYIRADQVTSQDVEDRQQGNDRQGEGQQGNERQMNGQQQNESPKFELPNRVAVTSGLNIGLQTLAQSSGGSILGEHNLPGRFGDKDEASSSLSLEASRWATETYRPPSPAFKPQQSLLSQIRHYSSPPWQPFQPVGVALGTQEPDTEMFEAFGTSSAQQKVESAPNLAASKHAPPGARVMATQARVGSTASAESTGPFPINRVHRGNFPTGTAPEVRQDKPAAISMSPEKDRNTYSSTSSRTGSLQADNPTNALRKHSFKASNLAASKWATPNRRVTALPESNKHLSDEPRQPGFQFASGDDADGEGDAVHGSQQKRNPFSAFAKVAAVKGPMVTHKPFVFGGGMAQEAKPNANVEPSAFQFSQPPTSKSATLMDSKWATKGQSSRSRIPRDNKPKAKGDLMASKYAPTNTSSASTTSFRKVRARADSSSEESEL
jgi:hypothetical protein